MTNRDRIIRIFFWLTIGTVFGALLSSFFLKGHYTENINNDPLLDISIASNNEPRGRICLVIDDFGSSENYKEFLSLHENIIFAIIPNTKYSNEISKQTEINNIETIVHMPMKTKSYPDSIYSEIILVPGMGIADIEKRLNLSFDDIPNAVGLNNHQGSIGTADFQLMKDLARCLKNSGKYFLDSYTGSDSKAFTTMRQYGVKTQIRQVFLDNDAENPTHINNQIDSLLRMSHYMEVAIGIGHIKPTTLNVLKKRIPKILNEGYEIVRLSNFVH